MPYSVAWKPFTDRLDVASVRLRSVLPMELLRRRGWRTELYRPGRRYDAVVFQKAYEDADVALVAALRAEGVRTVFDLCDNHYLDPGRAGRLARMVNAVDLVTVSTPELASLVGREDARIVGDALEVPRRSLRGLARTWPSRPRDDALRLVWFGNAGTAEHGLVHLGGIVPDLAAVHAEAPLRLTVISNSRERFAEHVGAAPFPTEYHDWDLTTFAHLFGRQQVCVLPVADNRFTRGKTNNRLVLSLMLGVPVVADPIPSYREFADFVLFADWRDNLLRYAKDPGLRAEHVRAGRAYVESHHSNDVVAGHWSDALAALLGTPAARPAP